MRDEERRTSVLRRASPIRTSPCPTPIRTPTTVRRLGSTPTSRPLRRPTPTPLSHTRMQPRQLPHHRLVLRMHIRMHRLRVLSQIIEARELLEAVAGEGAFAGMFAKMRGGGLVWVGRRIFGWGKGGGEGEKGRRGGGEGKEARESAMHDGQDGAELHASKRAGPPWEMRALTAR